MEHLTVRANGAAFHVARTGIGPPLWLLHGWPEFWLSWEPVMTRLADRFTLYAPDLRGFGATQPRTGLGILGRQLHAAGGAAGRFRRVPERPRDADGGHRRPRAGGFLLGARVVAPPRSRGRSLRAHAGRWLR